MGKTRSFTDADGDTYTIELSPSGENITIIYDPRDSPGVDLFVFKAEDADRLAAAILDTAQEARK